MAARAEIGTHEMSGARTKNAIRESTPSKNPESFVVAPLEILTRVAPKSASGGDKGEPPKVQKAL